MEEQLQHQPLIQHLKELKYRLTFCVVSAVALTIPSYFLYDLVISLLSKPFETIQSLTNSQLFINSLFEGFNTKIKFALMGGLILGLPIHVYHLLRFCLPGLYRKERIVIMLCLLSSVILAFFSLYIGYFILLPFSVEFLTSHEFIPKNVGILLGYRQNIFYIFNFLLYAMIAFQIPILLEVLLFLNLIKRKTLFKASRFVIVSIFIISAIVTPPDIISQLGLSIPLIFLYFLTILIAKIFKFGE